jgi:hypothetical protein
MKHSSIRLACTVVALAATAACSGSSHKDDLSRDLDLAGSNSGLELAPAVGQTQIVSAVERPKMVATPAPSRHVSTMRQSPRARQVARVSPASEPAPMAVVPAPAPSETPSPEVIVAPRPQPATSAKAPRGGWSTVGDVIRNAPFPINP